MVTWSCRVDIPMANPNIYYKWHYITYGDRTELICIGDRTL